MLPVSAAFTSVYLTGGRRLAPLIAAHWTLDLSAASAEATDWQQIALLHGELTPVVEANRAVAVAMAEGPAAGLVILDALAHHPQLRRWAQLYIARAELLRRLGRYGEATDTYRSALELEPAPASCPSWPDVCGN